MGKEGPDVHSPLGMKKNQNIQQHRRYPLNTHTHRHAHSHTQSRQTHTDTQRHTHKPTETQKHIYANTQRHINTHRQAHTQRHTQAHIHKHTYRHVQIHTDTDINTHRDINTYAHTHTHTHTHTHGDLGPGTERGSEEGRTQEGLPRCHFQRLWEVPPPTLFGRVVHALTLMTGRLGPERAEHLSEVTQQGAGTQLTSWHRPLVW